MNSMNMPGFTAELALESAGSQYLASNRTSSSQLIIPQSKLTCAFKAGRLAGRCLGVGFDHSDCMALAADFNDFCNTHDL